MPKVTVWWARHDPWQKKLYWAVFARAGGICEACFKEPADQIHHDSYPSHRREELRDLRALCARCHTLFHHPEAANDNFEQVEELDFG